MSGLVDMGGAIASFQTGSYTVTRTGMPTVSGGISTPGSTSTFDISASIQPATPEHIQRMPEGARVDDVLVLYTTAEVRSQDEATGAPPDRVSVNGRTYELTSVRNFAGLGGFLEVLGQRVDPT